jgi:hypothetical protein
MEFHIIDLLYLAPFSLKYSDMAPDREHIIEKYDAYVGILLNCYIYECRKLKK